MQPGDLRDGGGVRRDDEGVDRFPQRLEHGTIVHQFDCPITMKGASEQGFPPFFDHSRHTKITSHTCPTGPADVTAHGPSSSARRPPERARLGAMPDQWKPVLVGAGAGLLLFVLPDGAGALVIVIAALLAGWVLPQAPMAAATLFLAPTVVLGTVRLVLDDGSIGLGSAVFALVTAILVTAIFTHLGAGLALRRRPRAL